MWIFVKSGNAGAESEKKRIDNIWPSDKVEHLKGLIAKAMGMDLRKMRVFHKGKSLEDGHTLFEYSIKQDETLQVFARPTTAEPENKKAVIEPSSKPTAPKQSLPVPPLAGDDESDSDSGPDVIPGTRVISPNPTPTKYPAGPRTTDYDDEEIRILQSIGDACDECFKWPKRPCSQCGCFVCGGKDDENQTLVCDECEMYYHLRCLDPPLTQLPEEEWFCPRCKHDTSQVILPGQKLPKTMRKSKVSSASTGKKWGGGMQNVGLTKTCTIVGKHHFGPIPGIEVGQTWKYRIQCAESGVHRPPVAGISGSSTTGSQSIVLSGGYKDDVDNGDTFLYTGSGGRSTSDGSRVPKGQSFDQTLTKSNRALAMTLDHEGELNSEGAIARDWRKSKPVRVVRSDKMKHSKYAPDEGFRYDGIYKLARYWSEKGQDGYVVIRYEFRRDDPAPAPWTEEGKHRIEELGLEMVFPDNWDPVAQKAQGKSKKRDVSGVDVSTPSETPPLKKPKKPWKPNAVLLLRIEADTQNTRLWTAVLAKPAFNVAEFVQHMADEMKCPVCLSFVQFPVTTRCGHNVCRKCLENSVEHFGSRCPSCRTVLVEDSEEIREMVRRYDDEKGEAKARLEEEVEERRRRAWKLGGGAVLNERLIHVLRFFGSTYSTEET
ncbi:PUA-like domain-containing protein [Kalaharituber pfeilii]|nr:PUA-like domain-containing protein [Kalaharituber pfeilii]